jgi:serine/threonine protein kinase/tetratricopeptide (TPR) repeat protein
MMQGDDGNGGWPHGRDSSPPTDSRLEQSPTGVEDASDFSDSLLREVVQVIARPPVMRHAPPPGARLGGWDGRRFELLQKLGAGGMGWVMRAWDAQLQRVVALKFLLPSEELVDVALREARIIAQLDHENIVRVFDVQEWRPSGEQRIPFLVMECLEGESLAALMRRERLEPRRALELMSTIAAGLAHAHEHHIVHRDLKPSNVFLTHRGTVKLIDFGLAHLTQTRTASTPLLPVAGTPPYMAPEQWRGEVLDERTDIWGAGVMLYEMLTGELPYPEGSLKKLRARILSPEPMPSLREHHPELPWALESLVAVALAKEPAKRLISAAELQEELRELEEHLRPGPRSSATLAPERRQVTLVSCRLEGLASLSRELDPEDFGELEATFQRAFTRVIQQHRGFVTLAMGSEAQACFGYPVAHEQDSEYAVRAGLLLPSAIQEALQPRLWAQPQKATLQVKVGIHTDLVMLDSGAQDTRGGATRIQGEAPRLAARLAQQSGSGEVLLSHETWALVQRAFVTRPLGMRDFETPRLMPVYRVVGVRQSASRFDRMLTQGEGLSRLVGRERELGELLTSWNGARKGQGGFVLLHGEAGIGKSRLIQELCERVPPLHAAQLKLQCWSQFSTSAFQPVIELVWRSWLSAERAPSENLRVLEEWLARGDLRPVQMQLLASLLSLPVPEASPHLRLTPERQMEEVLEALGTLLLRTAAIQPVLLVVEDLHWADPSTLKLLGSLIERVKGARILGVLSARPEFRVPWGQSPGYRALAVERLSPESTVRLVKDVARGRKRLPETVMEQLVTRTDGVPLFVEEMTHKLLEGGDVASIPSTLQELLLARLDTLPPRQKALAQLCSVVGRCFTRELLATVTGMGTASLQRSLAGLTVAGVLRPDEDGAGSGYQFRHALIQEAAHQSLPRDTRREHHRRIARALVEHFPDVAECRPELLAHHYTEAGELTPAIAFWQKAGLRSALCYANEEAVSHLTQALKLLRSLPGSSALAREELRVLMALGLPLAQLQGYRSPEVERTYSRTRELILELGDALAGLELPYWGAFSYFFTQKKFQEAHAVAELLVRLGQRHHIDGLESLGHRMIATDHFNWGNLPLALEHIEQALASSGDASDLHRQRALAMKHWVNPRAMALAFSSLLRSASDELDVAREQAREAVALADKLGHPHTFASVLTYAALGAQHRRDAHSTLEWARRCFELSSEHRFRLWQRWSKLLKAWAMAWLGQAEEGLELMCEGLVEYEQSGFQTGIPHNHGMLAGIYLLLGRTEEGLAAVRKALDPSNFEKGERAWVPDLHFIHGQLLELNHQDAEAREAFLRALHTGHQQGARLYMRWVRDRLLLPQDAQSDIPDMQSMRA